jgi:hypothetical protein
VNVARCQLLAQKHIQPGIRSLLAARQHCKHVAHAVAHHRRTLAEASLATWRTLPHRMQKWRQLAIRLACLKALKDEYAARRFRENFVVRRSVRQWAYRTAVTTAQVRPQYSQ